MYGLNLNPLLPVRTEASECAEMCTQLLFGEMFDILEISGRWMRIRNFHDRYQGWCDRKMATQITSDECEQLLRRQPFLLQKPFVQAHKNAEPMTLPAGSRFYSRKGEKTFRFREMTFRLPEAATDTAAENGGQLRQNVVAAARQFLNAPYLWGGKSILGIDCSGLTQLSYDICGVSLPRDASQQIQVGDEIALRDAQAGDLAFFSNENGKITHVGMLLGDGNILHASGRVKIEPINENGIFSPEMHKLTHRLSGIRRIVR